MAGSSLLSVTCQLHYPHLHPVINNYNILRLTIDVALYQYWAVTLLLEYFGVTGVYIYMTSFCVYNLIAAIITYSNTFSYWNGTQIEWIIYYFLNKLLYLHYS